MLTALIIINIVMDRFILKGGKGRNVNRPSISYSELG